MAREVPGTPEQIAAVRVGPDYGKPDKPKIDRDDPHTRDALVSARAHVAADSGTGRLSPMRSWTGQPGRSTATRR